MPSLWMPQKAPGRQSICSRLCQEARCHLLTTDTWQWFPPYLATSLSATMGEMFECQWWHMEVWCIPSATNVPCVYWSQNEILSVSVFVYLFFETPLNLKFLVAVVTYFAVQYSILSARKKALIFMLQFFHNSLHSCNCPLQLSHRRLRFKLGMMLHNLIPHLSTSNTKKQKTVFNSFELHRKWQLYFLPISPTLHRIQ